MTIQYSYVGTGLKFNSACRQSSKIIQWTCNVLVTIIRFIWRSRHIYFYSIADDQIALASSKSYTQITSQKLCNTKCFVFVKCNRNVNIVNIIVLFLYLHITLTHVQVCVFHIRILVNLVIQCIKAINQARGVFIWNSVVADAPLYYSIAYQHYFASGLDDLNQNVVPRNNLMWGNTHQ